MCFKQTKHVYFKLKQYVPNIRTSICSFFFFPQHVIFCLCSLYNWKQITDIYFGDTFSGFHFKKSSFFLIISSCTGLTVCRLFVLLRNRKHCRTPQTHSLKTLQQHFKRRGVRNGASNCRSQVFCASVFSPLPNSQDSLLSSIGRSKLIFPIYNWNILVGNSIKFAKIRLIKTGGLASQLIKGKRK